MPNGTLSTFLRDRPRADRTVLVWLVHCFLSQKADDLQIRDIVAGLRYMHLLGIVHGDLKSVRGLGMLERWSTNVLHSQSNILINDRSRACLGDFGLSVLLQATTKTFTGTRGTLRWMAPELLDYNASDPRGGCFTTATDIYALAMVIWEVSVVN
jgi:serine/threonine protein kinase